MSSSSSPLPPPSSSPPPKMFPSADAFADGFARLPAYRSTTWWNFDGSLQFELVRLPFKDCALVKFAYQDPRSATPLVNSGYLSREELASDCEAYDASSCEWRYTVVMDGVVTHRQLNELHRLTACGCGLYVRRREDPACAMCHMRGLLAGGAADDECPLCAEPGLRAHMPPTRCCGKRAHAGCLDRCGAACPFCRAPRATA